MLIYSNYLSFFFICYIINLLLFIFLLIAFTFINLTYFSICIIFNIFTLVFSRLYHTIPLQNSFQFPIAIFLEPDFKFC